MDWFSGCWIALNVVSSIVVRFTLRGLTLRVPMPPIPTDHHGRRQTAEGEITKDEIVLHFSVSYLSLEEEEQWWMTSNIPLNK